MELVNTAAPRINALHKEIHQCFEDVITGSIPKAIEIGGVLHEEKQKLVHGTWIPWVKENLVFGRSQAYKYIKIWEGRDEILNVHSNGHLGIDKAVKLLSEPGGDPLVSKFTGNQENYTSPKVIEDVRNALGDIDLDPASCELAQKIVRASTYYTEEMDGLSKPWYGRVFLNPPYQQPEIKHFTNKLLDELPHIDSAILLTNNNTDTQWFVKCAQAAKLICLTTGRLNFYTEEKDKTYPTNGQAFFYYGDDPKLFKDVFRERGLIVKVQ